MTPPPDEPKPRRRRRLVLAGFGLIALAGFGLLALPRALSGRAGRVWLLGRADRAMAPGRFELETLDFSWFGPTRMTGFAIRDARGDRVLVARRATWDRTFRQVLFERPRLGTLRLDGAEIEAEREADGSIDLYNTLRPLLGLNPKTSLRVVIRDGRLRLRGQGLVRPVLAERAEVMLEVVPKPGPVGFTVGLSNGPVGARRNTLTVRGRIERGPRPGDPPAGLDLEISGSHWPWAVGDGRLAASGELDGSIRAHKASGRWRLSADAALDRVEAGGSWLAGDSLRVETVRTTWDVAETATGWSVRNFSLDSPLATLSAGGSWQASGPADGSARLVGTIDLAALAAQLPRAFRLREGVVLDRGTAEVRAGSVGVEGAAVLDLTARVSNLRGANHGRPFLLREPATLAARLRRSGGVVEVERFTADTAFFKGEARGDLTRGVRLQGSIDLADFQRQLREVVDFGAVELGGVGSVTGTYKAVGDHYQGRLDADLRKLRVGGLERDSVGLAIELQGPADASGLPGGWTGLQSRLTSGEVTAGLTARADGPSASVVVSGPVAAAGRAARIEGRVEARRDGDGVALDPVVISLNADGAGGANPPEPIRLSARGRFDRSKGELVLQPTGGPGRSGPVAFSAEGVRVTGLGLGGGLRVDGGLGGDLAALGSWVPSAPAGLRGRWTARASGRSGDDGLQLGGRVDVEGLAWGDPGGKSGGEPLGLAVRASAPQGGGRVDLTEFVLTSRFGAVEATGTVDDPSGRRLADLVGKVSPDWDAVNAWLARNVEPGAKVGGQPRALRFRGPLGGDWRASAQAEAGVALDGLDVYGMRFGPTSVVVRARDGQLELDPIDTSVNDGRLRLGASIRTGADAALVLTRGSSLTDAKVNDEVSRRVLSFVAPVLDNATRVRGRVSASIDEAVFPIGDADRIRGGPTVKGAVVFQDVEFMPGPLVADLLDLVGREGVPILRLSDPVSLSIADRRVYQRGLVIPVGRLTKVEMEGWVGFDHALNLTASIPVLPTMLADRPLLGDIAADARVRVPIRGTLEKPEVDREAFKLGMKDMGRSLLERGVTRGAAELLMRMTRGRDPAAPPPPPRLTPEERKERQTERRAERRARRGLPP